MLMLHEGNMRETLELIGTSRLRRRKRKLPIKKETTQCKKDLHSAAKHWLTWSFPTGCQSILWYKYFVINRPRVQMCTEGSTEPTTLTLPLRTPVKWKISLRESMEMEARWGVSIMLRVGPMTLKGPYYKNIFLATWYVTTKSTNTSSRKNEHFLRLCYCTETRRSAFALLCHNSTWLLQLRLCSFFPFNLCFFFIFCSLFSCATSKYHVDGTLYYTTRERADVFLVC